ncbi:MAG: hypothetical protein NZL96_00045 [Patescibacteria group bacterium]|nr:hypothetical protein [Patescibacteria group bacterium]
MSTSASVELSEGNLTPSISPTNIVMSCLNQSVDSSKNQPRSKLSQVTRSSSIESNLTTSPRRLTPVANRLSSNQTGSQKNQSEVRGGTILGITSKKNKPSFNQEHHCLVSPLFAFLFVPLVATPFILVIRRRLG